MAYVPSMTEAELIHACLNEDRLAQRALYDRYSQAMYTLARRITADTELANDVLQEAFVKVFRNLHTFRRESTLGAWIKTIVLRTALSKVRKRIHFEEINDTNTGGLIDWGDYLQAEYLEKAIRALPQGYRTIFLLVEVEGYTHREAGELLGISTGTSKSQLFYAKKKLRQLITNML